MLSRVADSIYWLCRYIERAENLARFVDVNLHLTIDLQDEAGKQWEALIAAAGEQERFFERHQAASRDEVISFLTFESESPNSIVNCLRMARENARSVREIISSEMWEQVNEFHHYVTDKRARKLVHDDPHAFFRHFRLHSHLFVGLMEDVQSHGEGWHFGRLGRLLERADKTSRILDVKYFILLPQAEFVGQTYDNIQWAAVLKSASGLEMYRKQYHRITLRDVSQFLLFDPNFPRSVRYCLQHAQESVFAITGTLPGQHTNEAKRLLSRLTSELAYADIQEVFTRGMHEYIDEFQTKLNAIGSAIHRTFVAPTS